MKKESLKTAEYQMNEMAILRLYCMKLQMPFRQLTKNRQKILQDSYGYATLRLAIAIRNCCREISDSFPIITRFWRQWESLLLKLERKPK